MGMFDEIRCEAPLPDGPAPGEVWFQTKSFPDPCMCRYTITRDGQLIDSRGNDLEPEGYVIFYTLDEATSGDRQRRADAYQRGLLLDGDFEVNTADPEPPMLEVYEALRVDHTNAIRSIYP